MNGVKPTRVRLTAVAHATEDVAKVSSAVVNICPQNFPKKLSMVRAKGHFGNEIVICSLFVKGKPLAPAFLQNILSHLSVLDRQMLMSELETRLDSSGVLHMRFDKQYAAHGQVRMGARDAIKAEVSFELRGASASVLRNGVMIELRNCLGDV